MAKRPLAPRFINQLDDYLLRNRPDTWSTRIHLVIWYTLLFAIGLSAISFMIPDNPLHNSHVEFWVMSQSVLVIVGIVLWIVYLVRFNTFKSYGTVHRADRLKTYALYFVALVLMVSTVFIPPVIETYKTMIRYSPSEVADDINTMNVLLAQLTKDETPAEVTVDSIFIIDSTMFVPPSSGDSYQWDDSLGAYVKKPIYLTRQELQYTLTGEDSVVWISNDKLLRFQCSSLRYIGDNQIGDDKDVHLLTNFEIYNRVYNTNTPIDQTTLSHRYFEIANKYIDPQNENDWDYSYYIDQMSNISTQYQGNLVNAGISNICSRLYRWEDRDFVSFIHVIYYIAMFLGLCLYIFRHSTVRTFFMSILAGILITILTVILGFFLRIEEEGAMITFLVYFTFFLVFSLATVQSRTRSVFTGMSLNLAVVCTPFVPLFITLLYYRFRVNNVIYDALYYDNNAWQEARDREYLAYQISEIVGFVLLLVMLETVFKWMYRKWYAAPEE